MSESVRNFSLRDRTRVRVRTGEFDLAMRLEASYPDQLRRAVRDQGMQVPGVRLDGVGEKSNHTSGMPA